MLGGKEMRKLIYTLVIAAFVAFGLSAAQAQTTGSIAGTVVDQNGAVVPNATVVVKGESGQEFTVVTNDNGTYRIPAVANGIYTLTVTTTSGFKKYLVSNVKVDVGLPTTVDAALEVGGGEQVVEVTSGGEVLQTETAAVSRNITGRQITETPIASRDALDLVLLMPGTNSVGAPRRSSINGLPKGSLNISIDGVDVQDNLLRSSDGFFTYVRPRVDAIDEVTISTANPGAESGGDGAVQIKFVTKRGTNAYRGGVFYQHRNTALNANYFFLNRDGKRDDNGKALRQKIQLNQYGGRLGGPIPFPHIGEGGPFFHSGKDKAFFFFNYEQFRQPESNSRTRVVLTPAAQAGNFSYVTGTGTVETKNLYTIASTGNCVNTVTTAACTATPDPAIAALLTRIRAATGTTGTLTPISGDPNRLNYNFTPAGGQIRKFLALRFDFNLTKKNSLEFITNRQKFDPSKDFLNSQDERFPGFPAYAQGSNRNSYSTALRSTITNNLINEARFAVSTGLSVFSPGISASDFDYAGGYNLGSGTGTAGIQIAGITGPTSRNSYSNRNTPTYDFTDSVNVIAGSHTINFGGQYKLIRAESTAINQLVPTINFGIDGTDGAFGLFSSTTLPGSTTTQQAEARNLYAALVGRVSGYANTAYLTADGSYVLNGTQAQLSKQKTYGLFAQDSWKVRPNLTVNYGLRWQPQSSYIILSDNYARLNSFEDVYGVSGAGNIFKPGTLTGRVPTVVAVKKGESAYPADNNNFAPSIGAVYSPGFDGKGILHSIFGSGGRSVFRGGYSISYVREGFALVGSILGANPGGNLSASRNTGIANSFTVGTNLRDPNNRNLTPNTFAATPAYPITLTTANSANAFDPNLKTGSVHSFSFGYQRELDKNTVVEVRYVGNRGYDLFRQHNINEFNTIENGFAAEFGLAQANLYANEAAFAAGQTNRRYCPAFVNATTGTCVVSATNSAAVNRVPTFAYFGANTGTSPLQIIQSYFSAPNNPATPTVITFNPANSALYNNANFANATLVNSLSRNNPNLAGSGATAFAGTNFENSAARRANAIGNGLASNFFYVNPTTAASGAYIVDNSARSWYDSGVIELRRRLSDGLRFQASYVWGKAQSDSFQSNSDNLASFSNRENGLDLAKNVAVFDIRHAFKLDATYDLPFGKGAAFFTNANGFVNAIVGGFSLYPTIRWQSGSPFSFGNVRLVGMTKKELQKEIKVRKDSIQNGINVVTFLPDDIILNTQKAFDINVASASGYGTTFGGGGAPSGRFIAPAGYGNCIQRYVGECGFNNLIVYGPGFFKFDVSLSKKVQFDEKRNIELRATFLDALNHPNFRIGGWATDVTTATAGGSTFGQLGNGTAYQDISTTNDPGGRLIDIMLRINF